MSRALLVALVLSLAGLVWPLARAAFAQPTTESVLARTCVAEAGFALTDCAALLHVLGARAERAGVTVEAMARRYASVWRVRPNARARWVLEVSPSCEQPAHWPARLSWPAYVERCEALHEVVRAYLAGTLADPCRGRAVHWGSRTAEPDVTRAARAGWREARCSRLTINAFYVRGTR